MTGLVSKAPFVCVYECVLLFRVPFDRSRLRFQNLVRRSTGSNKKKKPCSLKEDVQKFSQFVQREDGTVGLLHLTEVNVRGVPAEDEDNQSDEEINNAADISINRGDQMETSVFETENQLNSSTIHPGDNNPEPSTSTGGSTTFIPKLAARTAVKKFTTPKPQLRKKRLFHERLNPRVDSNQQCEANKSSNTNTIMTSEDHSNSQLGPISHKQTSQEEDCVEPTESERNGSEHHTEAGNQVHRYTQTIAEGPEINHVADHSSIQDNFFTRNMLYPPGPSLNEGFIPNNEQENVLHHPQYRHSQSNVSSNLNNLYRHPHMPDLLYQPDMAGPPYGPTDWSGASYHHPQMAAGADQPTQMAGFAVHPSHSSSNFSDIHQVYLHLPSYSCADVLANVITAQRNWYASRMLHNVQYGNPSFPNIFSAHGADNSQTRHENYRGQDAQVPIHLKPPNYDAHSSASQQKVPGQTHHTIDLPLSTSEPFVIVIK